MGGGHHLRAAARDVLVSGDRDGRVLAPRSGLGTRREPARELGVGRAGPGAGRPQVEPGIVHHSDRGVQYCCQGYVEKLQAHGFVISMSRAGNPYDNAKAESFMKTLKSEEVYLQQYRDQEEARASIQRFVEEVYNRKRLHSSLGYLSPEAFEEQRRSNPGMEKGAGE